MDVLVYVKRLCLIQMLLTLAAKSTAFKPTVTTLLRTLDVTLNIGHLMFRL
jgi:hypothetical protein